MDDSQRIMGSIHAAFGGTGISYRVHTVADESDLRPPVAWPPALNSSEENPAYPRGRKRLDSKNGNGGPTRSR